MDKVGGNQLFLHMNGPQRTAVSHKERLLESSGQQ